MIRHLLLSILLVFLLWWRWQVSSTRFFDADEFTHLHWAANFMRGERPYIDFFTFFTPGFYWFLQPVFWIFGSSVNLFLAARAVSFFIFLSILSCLGYLFGKTRGWKWALLPPVLLAFLPMPYDKFLEIRPDNLATLIGLIGVIWEIRAIGEGKKSLWFWSGFFYALSLIVLVKMIPLVAVAVAVAVLAKNFRPFFTGLLVPSLLFLLWLVTLGDFGSVWYSLTKMPLEANMIGKLSIMEPHLFFFPNASFYGPPASGGGLTLGLILNHAIWLIGIGMGVFRFFTPFVTAVGDKKRVFIEVLLSGIFLLSVLGYVRFFPLKHSQYLIPIAVFIAYYCADFIVKIGERWGIWVIGAIALLVVATMQVNQPKLAQSMDTQMSQLVKLQETIDPNALVVDFEGRMLFWRDGYEICCLPFGSFTQFLSQPPRPFAKQLEDKKIPYIFQGDTGRLWLMSSADVQYVRAAYVPVSGWGEALWRRK